MIAIQWISFGTLLMKSILFLSMSCRAVSRVVRHAWKPFNTPKRLSDSTLTNWKPLGSLYPLPIYTIATSKVLPIEVSTDGGVHPKNRKGERVHGVITHALTQDH